MGPTRWRFLGQNLSNLGSCSPAEGQGMEGGINVSFTFEAGVMCVGQETPGLNPWFPQRLTLK